MQIVIVRAILSTDRLRREDAEALGKAVAKELGLQDIITRFNAKSSLSPEQERKDGLGDIEDLITSRATPAKSSPPSANGCMAVMTPMK